MKVLTVGSGVIGTVYGAHLAAGGHTVSALRRPPRTDQVAADGLRARDVLGGQCVQAPVSVVRAASAGQYDLVLVAVRADQLKAACAQLTGLVGRPAVVLFGNNPGGRSTVGGGVAGELRQGFPGIGGARRLADDPATLRLMCAAVTEAFAALRSSGVAGLPRNLALLHNPLLRPVAVRYWARAMRSPMGELCFAAHCRHAEAEMRALGDEVIIRLNDSPQTSHLRRLLQAA